ncbi:MAG: hypothetical protein ACLFWB_09205 [Armatimonadota bacterium]
MTPRTEPLPVAEALAGSPAAGVQKETVPVGFGAMCRHLREKIEFDAAFLLVHEHKHPTLDTQSAYPRAAEEVACSIRVPLDGAARELLQGSLRGAVCLDTRRSCCSLERQMAQLGFRSLLCVPSEFDGMNGIVCLGSRKPTAFDAGDWISLAGWQNAAMKSR